MNYFIMPGVLKVNINPENVFRAVEKVTGITKQEILSSTRDRPFVEARYLFAYIVKNKTTLTLKKIGEIMNKNHSSIIFYNKQMDFFIKKDQHIINLYKQTTNLLW